MSTVSIRAALETAVNAMTPAVATAWENVQFRPPSMATPYQVVHVLFAQPDNTVYGNEHQELGILQIRLVYPMDAGSSAVMARAELIRDTFYRGQSFASGGITVIINRTPEIMPAMVEDGRYSVTVRVRFYANITA